LGGISEAGKSNAAVIVAKLEQLSKRLKKATVSERA
jgi:hypothetical protein